MVMNPVGLDVWMQYGRWALDDPSTLLDPTLPSGQDRAVPSCRALVVVWSRHHPERVGEVIFAPAAEDAPDVMLGRGSQSGDEDHPRAPLIRQRPEYSKGS